LKMAELNFNALARPGPRGFLQGFEQGQEQRVVDENNRTTQEVNRFKLEELERDRDEMLQLQDKLKGMGQDPDLDKLMDVYVSSGRPDYVKMGLEGKQKLKEQRDYAKLVGGDMAAPEAAVPAAAPSVMRMPQAPAPTNALGSGTFGMGATAPANALAPAAPAPAAAPVNAMVNPNAGQIQQTQKRIDDLMRFAASNPGMAGQAMQQAKLLQDQLEMFSRAKTPETAKLADRFVPVGRLVFDRETQKYISPSQAQLAQSQERSATSGGGGAAMPKAPSGYRYTSTGDLEAIPGGPAAAGLTPKITQKREAAYPQATSSVKSFEAKSEQYIKELEKLRDDPGLNQITGPIYGRTPSASREGSRAQSLYDKIFAKGGFQALQDMRDASKTGGALGNVSNAEGVRLEKSTVGGLDRTQNIKDVQQGINDLIEEIRGSQSRVRDAYDETYSYRNAQPSAAPSASVVTNPKFPGFSVGNP
jgi:hypothetical protein